MPCPSCYPNNGVKARKVTRNIDPQSEKSYVILSSSCVKRRCRLYQSSRTPAPKKHTRILLLSTHAARQGVDISVTVCLCVCTVRPTDFSAKDKASNVKLCTAVHRRPGQRITHVGELCSPRSPKSDEYKPSLQA